MTLEHPHGALAPGHQDRTREGGPQAVPVVWWVAVGALAAAALALRLRVASQSLYGDELFTLTVAREASIPDAVSAVAGNLEVSPPLSFVLSWITSRAGSGLFWLRLPSLLAGVALVPVTFSLGWLAFSRRVGLLAAALVAVSPFAVFYSTEARAYSLLALLATGSTLVLVELARRERAPRRLLWAGYAALVIGAIYTHYTAVFVLGAQLLWVLGFRRDLLRPAATCWLVAAVAFVAWLPSAVEDRNFIGGSLARQVTGLLVVPLTPRSVVEVVARWLFGAPYSPLSAVPGRAALLLALAVLLGTAGYWAVAAAAGRLGTAAGDGGFRSRAGWLVALTAAAAPAGVVLASGISTNMLLARNLYVSLPAAWVLVAAAVAMLPGRWSWVGAAGLLSAIAVGCFGAQRKGEARPDFSGAAAVVASSAGEGAVVVDYAGGGIFSSGPISRQLAVYLEPSARVITARPGAEREAARLAARRNAMVAVVWPVLPGIRPPAAIPGFRQVDAAVFAGRPELRVAVYAPAGRDAR